MFVSDRHAIRAAVLAAILVLAAAVLGVWYGVATREAPYTEDQPTEVVEAGRPITERDTRPSRGANLRPEREVRYERVVEVQPVVVQAPPELVRDTVRLTETATTDGGGTVVRVDTVSVPDFDLLGRSEGNVDLTGERLRLTLYDPDERRYVQRFYRVPPKPEPMLGYRLTGYGGRRLVVGTDPVAGELFGVGDAWVAGVELEARFKDLLAYGRGGVEVPHAPEGGFAVRPSVEAGLRYRIAGR